VTLTVVETAFKSVLIQTAILLRATENSRQGRTRRGLIDAATPFQA
jgi:hypothetical protein